MKLEICLFTILLSIVAAGDEYSKPIHGLSHRKCIRGIKISIPLKSSDTYATKTQTHSHHTQQKPATGPTKSSPKAPKIETVKQASKPALSYKQTSPSAKKKSAPKVNTGYLNDFESDCFRQHNLYRRSLVTAKGEPVHELKWRKDLADKAQIWANKLVEKSIQSYGGISLDHSDVMNWGLGENLYSTKNGNQTCACATDAWFNEWPLYKNQKIPEGDFHAYGHYTQLAWPSTKYMGCAYGKNGDNIKFTVCEYDPPGNYAGTQLNVFVKGKQVY